MEVTVPIYEWQCVTHKCQHKFETFQGVDAPAPVCPECGGEVMKMVSSVEHRFYGKGWTKPNVK